MTNTTPNGGTMHRSNRKLTFTLTADNGITHTDKVHGTGFGAFNNAIDRAKVAVMGTIVLVSVQFSADLATWVFTNHETGEVVTATYTEAPAFEVVAEFTVEVA